MTTMNSAPDEKPEWLAAHVQALSTPVPERDLWPEIAAALPEQGRATGERRMPFAALAAGLLLAVLSVSLAWQNHRQQRAFEQQLAEREQQVEHAQQIEQLLRQIEAPYRYARVSYREAWPELRAALPAGTAQVIETNLQLIETARTEIENAVKAEPDNLQLQSLLHQMLEQELGLYKKAERISARDNLI